MSTTTTLLTSSDQPAQRRVNLSAVLRSLRDEGPRSRARLASGLSLNKATVSSLVAELMDRGLVAEGRFERGSVGRPGTIIELDGRTVCGVAAEINVNHVSTLALNLRGEVVSERRVSVDSAGQRPEAVLRILSRLLVSTLEDLDALGATAVRIVVGVAGVVDRESGTLAVAPNLGWHDVPVSDLLVGLLGARALPVEVHNEANLAVVAEIVPGDPERLDLLVVHGEVGIGGGIVSEGRRFDGARGFAGEFGHMVVEPGGRRCGCGRTGCWETTVGLSRLLALAADPDDRLRDPDLGLEERVAELDRRAEAGDSRTLEAIDEVARWVGRGTAVLVNVLNPGTIVLGGYLALIGHRMLETLRAELDAGVIAPRAGGTKVAVSSLGFGASVLGGALVALEHVLDDPGLVSRATDQIGVIS